MALFVLRVALEDDAPLYRVFEKLADAMQQLQRARDAFDRRVEVQIPGLVSDYAVLQTTTDNVWTAVEQAKKGEGFVIQSLEKDRRQREAEAANQEAEFKWMLGLLEP